MRMQMSGVNSNNVSGTVIINGQAVSYSQGRLTVNDVPLMISDDGDLIITMQRKVYGAVVNGQLKMLNELTPAQYSAIKIKYKL